MKKLRNFVLLGVFGLFLFTACKGEPSNLVDATLESVLPADSSAVFVVDYSNDDQIDAFRDLKDRFPETDLFEKFKILAAAEGETNLTYEDDIERFLDGKWRVGAGVILPEDIDFETFNFEELEFYIVAEFEESDAFEDFVNLAMEDSYDAKDFDYKEDGGIKYWSGYIDSTYIARYNDVFILTNSPENIEAAIERIEDGSGFQANVKVTQAVDALAPKNLGYMYIDGETFSVFFSDLYTSMGLGDLVQYFEGMGDVYSSWYADEDGIMTLSQSKAIDSALFESFFGDGSYKLSLIDKVNGDGLIAYSESANFGSYLQSFLHGFAAGFNSVSGGFDPGVLETNVLGLQDDFETDPDGNDDLYQKLLEELASAGEVSGEDVEAILNSPFAFAMSDVGGYIPTIAFYVDVDDAQAENAKKLTASLDVYMDKIISEFDKMVQEESGDNGVGFLKKDIEVVNGGGLHKLYIDWDAAPSEISSALAMATLSTEDLKLELYYGVTGNNVFVVALYPDFYEDYGKNAVSEREDFKEGFEKIGGEDTFYVSYFSLRPIVDMIGRYLDISYQFGFLLDEDMRNFDLYGRQFAGTLKYFISSTVYSEEDMMSKTYIRFEEVEE